MHIKAHDRNEGEMALRVDACLFGLQSSWKTVGLLYYLEWIYHHHAHVLRQARNRECGGMIKEKLWGYDRGKIFMTYATCGNFRYRRFLTITITTSTTGLLPPSKLRSVGLSLVIFSV